MIGAALALVATSFWAHVAPSPDQNNRYVRITVLPTEVRVAYLVFFGERPGAALRRRLDADHDGVISPAEAARFGDAMVAEVGPRVSLWLGGAPVAVSWRADVGLGAPAVTGGAFSVDLIARVPLGTGASTHELRFHDGWKPESPGESELRVETAPAVTLEAAHRDAAARGVQTTFSDPLGGGHDVTLRFTTPPVPAPKSNRPGWLAWGALALLAAAGAAVGLWRYRKL